MLILEKVWAKLFGSYQRIEGGTAGEALYPLTGCPTKFNLHAEVKDKNDFWKRMMRANDHNLPMCTAVASMAPSKSGYTRKDMKNMGLIDCHAYTLIHTCEVTLDDGSTERLCLIRNPWGRHEWKGAWSDGSAEWSQSIIAQVPFYKNKDDGCFWINYDNYLEYFYITSICYYFDDYVDETVPDQHP